ncbi:MAG: hypothetical protein J3Q66DRAFT_429918 [Benniella sp.]|nr:MAG: hypothetical protein J3Q66DRAFT_429918 [Benniella sp.]
MEKDRYERAERANECHRPKYCFATICLKGTRRAKLCDRERDQDERYLSIGATSTIRFTTATSTRKHIQDRPRRSKDHVHDSALRTSSELHAKATVTGSSQLHSQLPSRIPEDSTVKLCLNTHTNATISTSASRTSECSDQSSNIAGVNVPPASGVEVVMKSVELESPNTILRNRKLHRGIYPVDSSGLPHRSSHPEDHASLNSAGAGVASFPMKRKPSLSPVRGHVPTEINTDPGTFAMCVYESSPVGTSLKHAPLVEDKPSGEDNIDDNDSDFDWEEDKIYEDREKEAVNCAEMIATIESDVCCRPLHRQIHPWFTQLVKNLVILLFFLTPKFFLHRIHTHHHRTIILVEDGRPYTAVVIGSHLGYFVIQFLIMALFKLIHKFGTVKVKITLETHDGLVPHIARSVWLFVLIVFWAVFVHQPTCNKAKNGLDFPETIEHGVDKQCRRWIFWWIHRCLWGIQAMNVLYILKRYMMQILSDRQRRLSGPYGHYRWTEKPASWLATATTYPGGRSPSASRPNSSKEEKPPTASIVDTTTQKRSFWELLKNSFRKRSKKRSGTTVGSTASPLESIADTGRDNELEPQEFVRMSKKRKSKLIHSLRNKPIEDPYKKAKDLWTRICPPHRNHLERPDLEPPLKKEIMDRIWKLFDPNGGDVITRTMFKRVIVDMVNLRKSFTSSHKTFENAMAKFNMLFDIIVLLFVIVAFLIAYDVGVQQYAVGVSSLAVGCAFVTGTSAKNAFESMVFIFIMRPFDVGDRIEMDGQYFTILTTHILTTEMKRGDGMRVLPPNYILATRHIHNVSRSDEHVDNFWMDIPLFSTARTIQRLKQRIQTLVEGEAVVDYHKIDVILNATNNHTKEGANKACLQILFRVFYRCRWVDSDYGPRKLKAILFLRATLNELEQEDLNDLIALRRAIGYGNHALGNHSNEGPYPPPPRSVLNEAGEPVGFVGTSGNVYDSPRIHKNTNVGTGRGAETQLRNELGAMYLARRVEEMAHPGSPSTRTHSVQSKCKEPCGHRCTDGSASATGDVSLSPQRQSSSSLLDDDDHHGRHDGRVNSLDARHVLDPETIQLSTNGANFQPYPNGFQFQR